MLCRSLGTARTRIWRLACCSLFVLSACSDPVSPIDDDVAVLTPGDTLFKAVVSGDYHSCALTTGGRAFCWGVGSDGQLGTGSTPVDCLGEVVPYATALGLCVNEPTPVAGGLRFTRLAAGAFSTCGITPSGRLYCWGGRDLVPPGSNKPVPIGGAMRFSDVDVSRSICAIGIDRMTYCWGDNSLGRLGIPLGTTIALDEARPVAGGHAFTVVRVSLYDSCGTTATGALYCWGGIVDTARFEVGDAVLSTCQSVRSIGPWCTHLPLKLKGADQWSRRALLDNPCAVTTAGGASCWAQALFSWGGAPFGITGSVSNLVSGAPPVPLVLPTPVRDVVGEPGNYGACAHAMDGRVVCWGWSMSGQFGDGIADETLTLPTIVAGGRSFAQLSAGDLFMCGLTTGGDVLCWGDAVRGVLGTGTLIPLNARGQRPTPTPTRVASIAGK